MLATFVFPKPGEFAMTCHLEVLSNENCDNGWLAPSDDRPILRARSKNYHNIYVSPGINSGVFRAQALKGLIVFGALERRVSAQRVYPVASRSHIPQVFELNRCL